MIGHDWSVISNLDCHDSYEYLVKVVTDTIETLCPSKLRRVSSRCTFSEPWMNSKLSKYNRKCRKLCDKARKTKNDKDYISYKNYRNTLRRLKKYKKISFYSNLFIKIGKNAKTLWSVLNSLNKKSNNKHDNTTLCVDGLRHTERKLIAEGFNTHFSSAGIQ